MQRDFQTMSLTDCVSAAQRRGFLCSRTAEVVWQKNRGLICQQFSSGVEGYKQLDNERIRPFIALKGRFCPTWFGCTEYNVGHIGAIDSTISMPSSRLRGGADPFGM